MAVQYRGYTVMVRRARVLAALIKPPGAILTMSEIPQATHEEGEAVLMERVKAAIDADIEAMARPQG